ncbi:MAG: pyridoxamine 5'-phosphate oxidase family protein [Dehalococcoidia bacterium]
MSIKEPVAEIDSQFSSAGAAPTPWAEAREALEKAEIYWLSTVRPDGRPHVTPLVAVWLDDALYFCTGEGERKNKNIEHNAHCMLTTGCNSFKEGLDLVAEGEAVRVKDETTLQRLASLWESKYDWPWTVRNGMFHGDEGNDALVYEVRATTVFGFRKGETFSQTRWRP